MIGYGNSYFVSTILDSGVGNPPVNTVAPVISGSTTLGSVLSSTTGTWTGDSPITYTYQWYRGINAISGATSSTYTLVVADSTQSITCQVTATNLKGSSAATSNTITAGNYAPINTVAPAISGNTTLGSLLSCTTGTWTGAPTITYSYQWKRNGNDIIGATSSLYTIQVADSGAALTCQVTATNSVGSASATSNTITANTFVAPTNTVAPALSGTAQEGQTLTTSTGTWTGTPIITYTYQWKRNGSNIGSATNSTYTLVTADVGQSIKCTVTATNAVGSANADSNTVTPTASTDADAQAFITAAGITDNTQKSAINQLVVDLKGYSIWTKFKAIYPIVGGTAATHKWNLKDPRDLDAAFRLTFATGWTHSSTGMTPNGATYANTFLKPSTSLSLNSTHISYYSRTNTNGTEIEMGAGIFALFIEARTSGVSYYRVNSGSILSHSDADSRALYLANRNASNSFNAWKNGVKQSTVTATADTLDTNNIYIGALGNGSTGAYNSTKQCAFASIGDGLTDSEAANFYTAVNNFQVALSRNI